MSFLRRRLRVWKEIFWKPWVGLIGGLYFLLQLWQAIWCELRPGIQEPLRLFHLIPDLSWKAWMIGWLGLALVVTLEGAYKAISRRDAGRSFAVRRLTELRERAISTLLNRRVASLEEVERVKADIAAWVDETLDVLSQCATDSEVSSFRLIGSIKTTHTGGYNAEHDHELNILSIRLDRLTAICQRLEAAR